MGVFGGFGAGFGAGYGIPSASFASSFPLGFGGSFPHSSVFLPLPAPYKAPAIKYTAVSFPYSSKGDKKE